MRRNAKSFPIILCFLTTTVSAQKIHPLQPVAPEPSKYQPASHAAELTSAYYRLICLVHLTGTGKVGDPRRPEYVPAAFTESRDGILAWSSQVTDDGKMAIIHLVAANRKAFEPLLDDKRSEVRVFEIGKHKREDIEKELKKYKKDFDLDDLKMVAR